MAYQRGQVLTSHRMLMRQWRLLAPVLLPGISLDFRLQGPFDQGFGPQVRPGSNLGWLDPMRTAEDS